MQLSGHLLENHFSGNRVNQARSEEHTSELQSHLNLVCRLLLEKKNRHRPFALYSQYRYPSSKRATAVNDGRNTQDTGSQSRERATERRPAYCHTLRLTPRPSIS